MIFWVVVIDIVIKIVGVEVVVDIGEAVVVDIKQVVVRVVVIYAIDVCG